MTMKIVLEHGSLLRLSVVVVLFILCGLGRALQLGMKKDLRVIAEEERAASEDSALSAIRVPSEGNSIEWFEQYLEKCKEKRYWAAYNATVDDGYDPAVNWKELCEK